MNASDASFPPSAHAPANADTTEAADPTALVAVLRRISTGAAADGQPWPEHHLLPGRRMAMADAECALAGLRTVQDVLLAAEWARQDGGPGQDVGDAVVEGLIQACRALTAQASLRLRPA